MRHARDARHLLYALRLAEITGDDWLARLDERSHDGLDAFDLTVWWDGYARGEDHAYDAVYGKRAGDVQARVLGRRRRKRQQAKQARRKARR